MCLTASIKLSIGLTAVLTLKSHEPSTVQSVVCILLVTILVGLSWISEAELVLVEKPQNWWPTASDGAQYCEDLPPGISSGIGSFLAPVFINYVIVGIKPCLFASSFETHYEEAERTTLPMASWRGPVGVSQLDQSTGCIKVQ